MHRYKDIQLKYESNSFKFVTEGTENCIKTVNVSTTWRGLKEGQRKKIGRKESIKKFEVSW